MSRVRPQRCLNFKYYDSVHLASDQKDLLISQLKAEIFEIQQRDKDFLALRDQLYSIQSKYRHLQDEKVSFPSFLGQVVSLKSKKYSLMSALLLKGHQFLPFSQKGKRCLTT